MTAIQRRLLVYSLISTSNCMIGLAALNYGANTNVFKSDAVPLITALGLGTSAAYYAAVLSGATRRFKDPTLIEPVTVVITAFLAWAYSIAGQGGVVAIPILGTVMMFCLFTCTSRQICRVCLYVVAFFGSATWYRLIDSPSSQTGSSVVDVVCLALIVMSMGSFAFLSGRLAGLRAENELHRQHLAEALTRIENLATVDELTGLYNRRHGRVEIQKVWERADRNAEQPFLCVIDIDHFKSINDQHGHAAGDLALQVFCEHLRKTFRKIDVITRWGGEEFVISFELGSVGHICATMDRLRHQLRAAPIHLGAGEPRTLSFSAGVVQRLNGESVEATLARADQALYAAKSEGRSRTKVLEAL